MENRYMNRTLITLALIGLMACIWYGGNLLHEPAKAKEASPECNKDMWIPTRDDIKYQDSMWTIINRTQEDVDTIKETMEHIIYKLDRLEYKDGTYDSIRTPIYEDEHVMWIGANGDTIWE